MQTMSFTVREEQTGRSTSTGSAGKSIILVNSMERGRQLTFMGAKRDAFTTTSDFIISPHAASKGLYVATCGSFHGFKFFPVLGKYIVQMLEGSLSQNLSEKWAWDRERPDPALNPDYPRVEMKYLLDSTRTSKL